MSVKVQYNPSTGRVSYNPSTGKVQVIDRLDPEPCGSCEVTPLQVRVTFENITNNTACFTISRDRKWVDLPDFNGVYDLTQIEGSPCRWFGFFEIPSPTMKMVFYNSTNGSCSGGVFFTVEMDRLLIVMNHSAGEWVVDTSLIKVGGGSAQVASGPLTTNPFVPESDCVNIEDEPNKRVEADHFSGYGGTVTVEDLL